MPKSATKKKPTKPGITFFHVKTESFDTYEFEAQGCLNSKQATQFLIDQMEEEAAWIFEDDIRAYNPATGKTTTIDLDGAMLAAFCPDGLYKPEDYGLPAAQAEPIIELKPEPKPKKRKQYSTGIEVEDVWGNNWYTSEPKKLTHKQVAKIVKDHYAERDEDVLDSAFAVHITISDGTNVTTSELDFALFEGWDD